MSFCRITGKSRGLPKPNYFPLLPPISPADAKRFCRITNKSQGLPGHHFIPAILVSKSSRAHCRVTGKSEGQAPHHFPTVENTLKQHEIIPGYKYVFPKFDEEHKLQRRIMNLISTKTIPGESNARYVYAVEERQTGLVIPAGLEAAVRDGEIRDVMLDRDNDTMLVKMHQGPSVTVDVAHFMIEEGMVLWEGLGPSQSVLKQREKEEKEMEVRKKKRKEGLGQRKQIFEDKERAADEEEEEMERIKNARKSKVVKLKMRNVEDNVDVSVVNGHTSPEDHLSDAKNEPVFGHIVQTATAVEFFPGDSILNLPEGKVVPGQLVRNADGVKFVPGIMSDGRFIPGQVVKTNSGDQFVPGQVVDTRQGPKFVPGQVVETTSGSKFVPGQTIETEDGPQFVPGQIIETKAGPTFIPGQIIVTDDEPRFVPGRVVETAEGPRFVPGRVVESGNQVTFVPGQVVETSEGLKFVAPDLEYNPEGGHEFSVQGFEVSPEELKLLRPAASCEAATCGVFTVDSKMLKQLSEAGMAVGRQVPTALPEVDIRPLPVVVEKLKLDGAHALKMSHVMGVLSQVALKISQRNDLCASEIQLDEDIGDKILCAAKLDKDLGKYLQAIVASAVVDARNNFDEGSLISAVSNALESALSPQYDSIISKDSLLAVISNVIDNQIPAEDTLLKEKLIVDINSAMESEIRTKLENVVTDESVMRILNKVLETKLGEDNSTATKATVMEAVKSAIEKEQFELYKQNVNKESFLTVINAVMDSGIIEKTNDLLSKESILAAIHCEIEKSEASENQWVFSEETIMPIIKSAIEKEVSASGVTLNNGSLPAAIMKSIKKELSQRKDCNLTEEKLMACLTAAIENDLTEVQLGKLTKKGLLQACTSAVAVEKSQARHKILSEEVLLATAFTALEKTVSQGLENIPNRDKLVEEAVAKIKEDVTVKHKNSEIKKTMLSNLEKTVEKKISEQCQDVVNEEMAIAAVNAVIEDKNQPSFRVTFPKQKIALVIKLAFEREKFVSHSTVMHKDSLMAVIHDFVEEEKLARDAAVVNAFNAAIEEKRKEKYESPLTEQALMSAVDSAFKVIISDRKDMKISKEALLSAVEAEIKRVKFTEHGNVTNATAVAVAHSVLKEEMLACGEKASVIELLLEAFNTEVEKMEKKRCQIDLTESEAISILDSSIKAALSEIGDMKVSKAALLSAATAELKKVKSGGSGSLSEMKIIAAAQSAIKGELLTRGEKPTVVERLLEIYDSEISKEKETKLQIVMSEGEMVETLDAAIKAVVGQGQEIKISRAKLVTAVMDEVKKLNPERSRNVTEGRIIAAVESAIKGQLLASGQDSTTVEEFIQAFEKEVENKEEQKGLGRLTESKAMSIVDSSIKAMLSEVGKMKVSKGKLISAVSSELKKVKPTESGIVTEGRIIAAVHSALKEELSKSGEKASVIDRLIETFDLAVESGESERNQFVLSEAEAVNCLDLAIQSKLSDGRKMKVNKSKLLSAVRAKLENVTPASNGNVTEGRIIAAVNAVIKEELLDNEESAETIDSILKAFNSEVEKKIIAHPICQLTETGIIFNVNSAIADILSEVGDLKIGKAELLSAVSAELKNVKSAKNGNVTEGRLIAAVHSALKEELLACGEDTAVVDRVLRAFDSQVGKSNSTSNPALLSDETVLSALDSAVTVMMSAGNDLKINKGELETALKMAMENVKTTGTGNIIEGRIIAAAHSALKENLLADGQNAAATVARLLQTFDAEIEKHAMTQNENLLTEDKAMSALDLAIDCAISKVGDMKVSKSKLLSAVASELKNVGLSGSGNVREGRLIAAAHSALKQELLANLEKASVVDCLLEAFDMEVENSKKMKSQSELTETRIMSGLDSAMEIVLSEVGKMKVSKGKLISAVSSELKKVKPTESGNVTEGRIIAAVHSALKEELSKSGEKASVIDRLIEVFATEIETPESTKHKLLLTEAGVISSLDVAIQSVLGRGIKMKLDKEKLLTAVTAQMKKVRATKSGKVAEGRVIASALTAVKEELMANNEDASVISLLMQTFDSEIEKITKTKADNLLTEVKIMSVLDSAIEAVLSNVGEMKVSKETLMSTVTSALKEIKHSVSEKVTEGRLIAAAESVIKEELLFNGEKASVVSLLLNTFENEVENEGSTLNEEEVISSYDCAIQAVMIEFGDMKMSKAALLSAAAAQIKHMKLTENNSSEGGIIARVQAAAQEDLLAKGEEPSVVNRLLEQFSLNINREKETKLKGVLTDSVVVTGLHSAINTVLSNGKKMKISKEALVSAISKELEVVKSARNGNISDGRKIAAIHSALKGELEAHNEDESVILCLLNAFDSAMENKERAKPQNELTESSAILLLDSSLESVLSNTGNLKVNKATLLSAVNAELEKARSYSGENLAEGRIIAAVHSTLKDVLLASGEEATTIDNLLEVFDSNVENREFLKQRNLLSESEVMSSLDSAIKRVLSNVGEMKVGKRELLLAVSKELKEEKFMVNGNITDGKIVAAVHSVVKQELAVKGEKASVSEWILEAFDKEIELSEKRRLQSFLTEAELLSTLDGAVEALVLENKDVKINQAELTSAVMNKVAEMKLVSCGKTTEGRIIAAIYTAVREELSARGEKASVTENLLKIFDSKIEQKEKKKRENALSDIDVISSVGSAIQSVLPNVNQVDKAGLLSAVSSELKKVKSSGAEYITQGRIIAAVHSILKEVLSTRGEKASVIDSLLCAFDCEIEKKEKKERKRQNLLTEAEIVSTLDSAIETLQSEGEEIKAGREKVISVVMAELESLRSNAGEELTEGRIIAAIHSAAKGQLLQMGEEASIVNRLLDIFDAELEIKECSKPKNHLTHVEAISTLESAIKKVGEIKVNKATLLSAVSEELEKMKPSGRESLSEGQVIAAVHTIVGEWLLASGEEKTLVDRLLDAFDTEVIKKDKRKVKTPLTEAEVILALDSAVQGVINKVGEMKVSKAALLSAVNAEMKKVKSSGIGTISEGRIIAAVHSAVKAELLSKDEKSSVVNRILNAFDMEVEKKETTKCQGILSEAEVLTTLETAIENELAKNPNCGLSKTALRERIDSAISKKKLKKRESILSENVLLRCMKTAVEEEVTALDEEPELLESLLEAVNSSIRKEKEAKKLACLNEESIIQAVGLAMNSELIQNNKISVTKDALVKLVKEAIEKEQNLRPESRLTEKELIEVVESTVASKISSECEAQLLLKAINSSIEQARATERKKPITEKLFIEIVSSAIEAELSGNIKTSLTKDILLSAVALTVENEVAKHGNLLTEEMIIATAYSEIEEECIEKGESPAVRELLQAGIDTMIESKRDAKRFVDQEIIFEAVNSIADSFGPTAKNKEEVLNVVKSAIENSGLIDGDTVVSNKKLLDIVCGAVEKYISKVSEMSFSKEAFQTAMSTAIAEEQSAKRGALMIKEVLSEAVKLAVEEELTHNPELLPIKNTLLEAANSAVESECTSGAEKHLTEKALLSAISSSIENTLGSLSETNSLEKVVESMQRYLSENLDQVMVGSVNCMVANESAVDKLNYALKNSSNTIQVIEKLSSVLNDSMGEAFQKLSTGDPDLLRDVIENLCAEQLTSKDRATEALQQAIVGAVRKKSVKALKELMESPKSESDGQDFKNLLLQSVGLAKALGMNQVASVLLDVASDSKSHEVLANDETVIDILQRLTIMRQFAETKPELASALAQLISDPELAKRDPAIRELVRHSTALMTVPEEMLRSSADIPASLLMSDNTLAMEQFLARARRPRTLVIVKHGLQAVVPKEAARAVLTGQVPYAVLDEKGIKYFEPLHVFSTMKLPYYASHCFSMYRCPERDYDSNIDTTPTCLTPRGSFSNAEDCLNQRKNVIANASRRFDKLFPTCKRVSELSAIPNHVYSNSCYSGKKLLPGVYRTSSASRISDFSKRSEFAHLRDIYD